MNSIERRDVAMSMARTVAEAYGNTWIRKEDLDSEGADAQINKMKIMVFGLLRCYYAEVGSFFQDLGVDNYSCRIGHDDPDILRPKREGIFQVKSRAISADEPDVNKEIRRICKAAITNIVLYNYMEVDQGRPIAPIIFCIENESNPDETLTLHTLTGRVMVNGNEKIITAEEIRRAYKLCTDPALPIQLRRVAQMTFRFFKVTETIDGEKISYALTPIPTPWENPEFVRGMDARVVERVASGKNVGESQWRSEVNNLIQAYHSSQLDDDQAF